MARERQQREAEERDRVEMKRRLDESRGISDPSTRECAIFLLGFPVDTADGLMMGCLCRIAVSPRGDCYASGGEDGFVRVHHFDESYFRAKPYGDLEIEE